MVVLGGGLSGLLAAHHLRRRGHRVEVWEAAERPGGWVETVPWPGPEGEPGAFERGPQELRLQSGGALHRLVEALRVQGRSWPSRAPRWLAEGGQTWTFPGGFGEMLATPSLSPGGKLRMLLEPLLPVRAAADLRTLLVQRIGAEATDRWAGPLLAGRVPAPLETLAVEALPVLERRLARGGLLLGGLREARLRSWVPERGVGALVEALAAGLGTDLRLGQPAERLCPWGRGWRVEGRSRACDVGRVILALPPAAAARLLRDLSPEVASGLAGLRMTTLKAWHSRHLGPNLWPRGFHLALDPVEGRGILGALSLAEGDPRAIPGLVQVRTYAGGAFSHGASAGDWPEVEAALRRWIPGLGATVQVREDTAEAAFPLPSPGHRNLVGALVAQLPAGLEWVGAARFGAGVGDLAEGLRAWADTMPPTAGLAD